MYKSEKFWLKVLSEMWDFLEVSLGQYVLIFEKVTHYHL